MAYGNKYSCQFYDYFGNIIYVYLLKKDYSSTVTELTGGGQPLVIEWTGQDDDFDSVFKASQATLSVYSTSIEQLADLFHPKVREWKMQVYKQTDPVAGPFLIWEGYIESEGYTEPMLYPPYESKIFAYDGLADLRDVAIDGWPLKSVNYRHQQIITVIADILNTIDFGLDIYVANSIIHEYCALNRVFEETFINISTLILKDNAKTDYYTILENILKSFNCRIFQDTGRWMIERYADKAELVTTYYYVYDSTGTYQSTSVISNKVTLTDVSGDPLCVWIDQSPRLEFNPAWKQFTIEQDLGERLTVLRHVGDHGYFDDNQFYGNPPYYHDMYFYQVTGSMTSLHYVDTDYLRISSPPYSGSQYLQVKPNHREQITPPYLRDPANIGFSQNKSLVKFNVNIEYALTGDMDSYGSASTLYGSFRIYVDDCTFEAKDANGYARLIDAGSTASFSVLYDTNNEWTTSGAYITFNNARYSNPDFAEYSIETEWLDVSGYTSEIKPDLRIYGCYYDSEPFGGTAWGRDVLIRKISITWETRGDPGIEVGHTLSRTELIDEDDREIPSNIDITYGDTTVDYNNQHYNKYCLLAFDDPNYVMNDNWGENYTKDTQPLINGIQRNFYRTQKRQPLRKISGMLCCDELSFYNDIKDSAGRVYISNGIKYDVRQSLYDGQWIELYTANSISGGAFDDTAFANSFDI